MRQKLIFWSKHSILSCFYKTLHYFVVDPGSQVSKAVQGALPSKFTTCNGCEYSAWITWTSFIINVGLFSWIWSLTVPVQVYFKKKDSGYSSKSNFFFVSWLKEHHRCFRSTCVWVNDYLFSQLYFLKGAEISFNNRIFWDGRLTCLVGSDGDRSILADRGCQGGHSILGLDLKGVVGVCQEVHHGYCRVSEAGGMGQEAHGPSTGFTLPGTRPTTLTDHVKCHVLPASTVNRPGPV